MKGVQLFIKGFERLERGFDCHLIFGQQRRIALDCVSYGAGSAVIPSHLANSRPIPDELPGFPLRQSCVDSSFFSSWERRDKCVKLVVPPGVRCCLFHCHGLQGISPRPASRPPSTATPPIRLQPCNRYDNVASSLLTQGALGLSSASYRLVK